MPTYTFLNQETNEVFDRLMSWSDRSVFLEQNPHIQGLIGNPTVGDPVRLGIKRTDDGFREVLSRIGQNNYKSNLSDKLSRR